MKKILVTILAIYPLLLGNMATASGHDTAQQEIQYLLDFIAGSPCTFIRNGTEYPAKDARAHIERKYGHVKSRIKNSEDFIEYAATKSSMSGDPYRVACAGKEILSKDWLLNELHAYRHQKRLLNTATPAPHKSTATLCTEPRPQICTRIYKPVCASLHDQNQKTYASDCTACADTNVISHVPGECQNDRTL